jgi:mannose/fructose/N-acetylgalactosamine-specific phosphotransferase system component IIC
MLLTLVLLGGVLALDGTSVLQTMASRPLVAATLGGWVVGDPTSGLFVGMVLEAIYLGILPAGGAQFPETGPASLIAGATAAGLPGPGSLAIALMVGLVWAQVGAVSISLLRRVNGRFVPRPQEGPVTALEVERIHLAMVGLDFVRGMALTGLALVTARLGLAVAAGHWPLDYAPTVGIIALGTAVPLGTFLKGLGDSGSLRTTFMVGVAGGLLLAAML